MPEATLINRLPIPPRRRVEPNPHIVSALRFAKRHLWDGTSPIGDASAGRSEFICNSLPYNNDGDAIASTIILPRLHAWCGDETVATFRQALNRVTYHYAPDLSSEAVQAARHARLDQLISEFGGE